LKQYELGVILHPDLEIDQEKPLKKIEKFITEAEGKIIARDDWGKRKLAYKIKNQGFGLYFFYVLELPPQATSRLEKNLNITDEVIRHLLVTYVEPPAEEAEEKPAKAKATDKAKAEAAKKPDSPAKTSKSSPAKAKNDKVKAKAEA